MFVFCRRYDELLLELTEMCIEDRKTSLKYKQADLQAANEQINDTKERLKELNDKLKECIDKADSYKSKLEDWEDKKIKTQEEMEINAKCVEEFTSKELLLKNKVRECYDKLTNLGEFSENYVEQYKEMTYETVSNFIKHNTIIQYV